MTLYGDLKKQLELIKRASKSLSDILEPGI